MIVVQLGYLAIAGVLIVLVSLIPRLLKRRSRAAGDLLKSVVIVLAIGLDPYRLLL
jgi:hypothetical protein